MFINAFRDNKHEEAFYELIEQSEITDREVKESKVGSLIRRQLAFLYLIALYQEDFKRYEGMKFYIEVYEEMSIDGPVYLLDEAVKLGDYPHEKMLKVAKDLLRGDRPSLDVLDADVVPFARLGVQFALEK